MKTFLDAEGKSASGQKSDFDAWESEKNAEKRRIFIAEKSWSGREIKLSRKWPITIAHQKT